MKLRICVIFIVLILGGTCLAAGHKHPEKWYQEQWCAEHNGRSEVVLADKPSEFNNPAFQPTDKNMGGGKLKK
jgi:hypothetical protein